MVLKAQNPSNMSVFCFQSQSPPSPRSTALLQFRITLATRRSWFQYKDPLIRPPRHPADPSPHPSPALRSPGNDIDSQRPCVARGLRAESKKMGRVAYDPPLLSCDYCRKWGSSPCRKWGSSPCRKCQGRLKERQLFVPSMWGRATGSSGLFRSSRVCVCVCVCVCV